MRHLVIIALSLFVFSPVFGITNSQTKIDDDYSYLELDNNKLITLSSLKKDPFAASMYSLVFSGAGQFYAGNYSLGSLLFLGESLYHLFNIGIRYKLQNDYGDSVTFSRLNTSDQILLGATFFTFIILKVYSIYDANISIRKYNKEIDEKLRRYKFSYIPGDLKASYTIRF
jgi:TM2 domain-containing membrane protein YozV